MRISDWSSGRVLFRSPAPAPATAERPAPGSGRHAEGDPAANHRVALKGGRCVPLERRGSNGDPGAGGIAMKLAYVGLCGFRGDRKSVVSGKRVSVRVDLGGRRRIDTQHLSSTACLPAGSIASLVLLYHQSY